MKMINPIRHKIKMIKVSQRSRHDRIISVLDDILTLIEERCGKDINPKDIISAMEKENERDIPAQEPETKPEEMG